jgi:hypothetical protein
MTRKRQSTAKRLVAATLNGVAATFLWLGPAMAEPGLDWSAAEILPAELRVALGDVMRLDEVGLPERHAEGLIDRIEGALGLLPWLLLKAGDDKGAEALGAWFGHPLDTAPDRAALSELLSALSQDYPLALAERTGHTPPAAAIAEARAIHEAYCMGCHDGFADGDPDERLPSRDLRLMARAEPDDIFLARLVNGVKGDETIAFINPLTERQVLALWTYYRTSSAGGTDE